MKLVRSGDKTAKFEYDVMERLKAHLEANKPARTLEATEDEEAFVKSLFLITSKPVLYACNISEDDMMEGKNLDNEYVQKLEHMLKLKIQESWLFALNLKKNYQD